MPITLNPPDSRHNSQRNGCHISVEVLLIESFLLVQVSSCSTLQTEA